MKISEVRGFALWVSCRIKLISSFNSNSVLYSPHSNNRIIWISIRIHSNYKIIFNFKHNNIPWFLN